MSSSFCNGWQVTVSPDTLRRSNATRSDSMRVKLILSRTRIAC